ncbi:hypothetical protein [Labrenzia sp. CE80]|uniref:hypothetical protein n=1 Tax=Labrenzia sp. CE80 TaxID=1788986 RepID=UPI00187776FB|nr:hypothetical protein [Labrenzia sp. CE80]
MSLSEALRGFDYSAGAAILLIILLTVSLLDIFGSLLRKVVIDGEKQYQFAAFFLLLTVFVIGIEIVLAAG